MATAPVFNERVNNAYRDLTDQLIAEIPEFSGVAIALSTGTPTLAMSGPVVPLWPKTRATCCG